MRILIAASWLLLMLPDVACTPPAAEPLSLQSASAGTSKLLLGVLVDTHPRPKDVIDVERQVVDGLMGGLAGVRADGFVSSYSDRVQPIADWSPVDPELRQVSRRLKLDQSVSHPGAALYDGVMAALTKLTSATDGDRRALVVIGEGNDGASVTKIAHVLDTAKRQHVQCFALIVATHRSQVGRVREYGFDLHRLASATQGRFYDIRTDPRLLDKAVQDVLNRLGVPVRPVTTP